MLLNSHQDFGLPLEAADDAGLNSAAAGRAKKFLSIRTNNGATPLHSLPSLASELGIATLHIKDEGFRLGMGSFKALGGAYAVATLVLEEASAKLGRELTFHDLSTPEVRAVATTMTVACATDGNHGRSVAQGAQLVGARSAIFVHSGVSDERIAAIACFGAEMISVDGTYDESVAKASETASENGWTVVSDTSWPGYERIPGLVMEGYTTLAREAIDAMREPPTHVFLQAGVGGFAAAVAGYLSIALGDDAPTIIVVEPSRAACIFETARAGRLTKIEHGEPTVMAMLECYEPSLVAWRILSRLADAFMTVDEDVAVTVMRRLAAPTGGDPAIVAGESGGAGLAGLIVALRDGSVARSIGLDASSRVLVINTEGATDRRLYERLVGKTPEQVLSLNDRKGVN